MTTYFPGILSNGALVPGLAAGTVRTTLGLGGAALLNVGTTAGTVAAGDAASASIATHAGLTSGVHGISAFGATLIDDAAAVDARNTLGLGGAALLNVGTTAGTVAAGDAASASIGTHAALTSAVHGISAFGATLIDDAAAVDARNTLGLGTADSPTFAGGTFGEQLNLRASTTAAGTAPIKIPTGVLMTTPEAGAVEYDGTNLYFTDSGGTRNKLREINTITFSEFESGNDYVYHGGIDTDGDWAIYRYDNVTATRLEADESNNPGTVDLATAWTNRASLNYT